MSELESPNQLPRQTTPTWEVELLISGVAVFAMFQLATWLDDGIFALAPRLDFNWQKLAVVLYYYLKSAAVILAVSFASHLLLRARWIALVGMHSVYPDGVQWNKLRMGSIQREVERRYQVPTEVVIERADNLATTVFAVGVMVALMMAIMTVVLGVLLATSNLLASVIDWDFADLLIPGLVIAFLLLPFMLITSLDRRYGAHWAPDSRRRRISTGLFSFFTKMGMGRSNNRVMALLASHGGDRKAIALTSVIMSTAIIAVMLNYSSMHNRTEIGSYEFFPSGKYTALRSSHYDDQRDPKRGTGAPFIQSMIVEGSYLKVVVPYLPSQDDSAMRIQCKMPAAKSGESDARLVACLQSLHPVTLDGTAVENLRYEVASDPRTDRPALLAMIDIRTLSTGRHELRIGRAPPRKASSDVKDDDADPDARDYIIPFWR